jgi:hypothetical protein
MNGFTYFPDRVWEITGQRTLDSGKVIDTWSSHEPTTEDRKRRSAVMHKLTGHSPSICDAFVGLTLEKKNKLEKERAMVEAINALTDEEREELYKRAIGR